MSRYFPNLNARRNPHEARRESNLRFLTNPPTKKANVKPPQNLPSLPPTLEEPSFAPPLGPPPVQDQEESNPSLLPSNQDTPAQANEEIVFLGVSS
jgi:hypothetical protein